MIYLPDYTNMGVLAINETPYGRCTPAGIYDYWHISRLCGEEVALIMLQHYADALPVLTYIAIDTMIPMVEFALYVLEDTTHIYEVVQENIDTYIKIANTRNGPTIGYRKIHSDIAVLYQLDRLDMLMPLAAYLNAHPTRTYHGHPNDPIRIVTNFWPKVYTT